MKFKTEKTGRIATAVLFAVLLAVCAAVIAGCGAYPLIQRVSNAVGIERRHTGSDPDMIKILLAETDGITVDSENPVYVPGGSDVTFEYTLKEGYTFDGIIAPEGAEISDGKIKLTDVRYPSTVIIESRPLRTCKIKTAVSDYGDGTGDAAGTVVCTPTVMTEGEEAVLIAEPAKYFSFVSYTADKPASEGGEVISESKIFNYRPNDSVTVYANFLRTSAPVTLLPNDGILNKSVSVIDLPLGKSGFFVIEEKEGFEITSIPDNTTLDRGLLTVTGVTGPTVLEIGTRMLAKYSLDVTLTDKNAGTVERSPAQSSGWEGTEVMLKAETNKGYTFDGYSVTYPLSAGGKLLTSNPEYMFTLDSDTRIFANFTQRKYTVTLKLSDGASLASGETTVTVISGESAEFPVTVENGYEFGYVTGGATYTDGIVRLGEVFEDTEIEFEVVRFANNDPMFYRITSGGYGHEMELEEGYAPNCFDAGKKDLYKCIYCDFVDAEKDGAEVAPIKHKNAKTQGVKAGDADLVKEKWFEGISDIREQQIWALRAKETRTYMTNDGITKDFLIEYVPATCEKDGYIIGTYCPDCMEKDGEGKAIETFDPDTNIAGYVIEAYGHEYDLVANVEQDPQAPVCGADNYSYGIRKCYYCGEYIIEDFVPALFEDHEAEVYTEDEAADIEDVEAGDTKIFTLVLVDGDYVDIEAVEFVACTDTKYEAKRCVNCGEYFDIVEIAPVAHQTADGETIDVTCTGYSKDQVGFVCEICGLEVPDYYVEKDENGLDVEIYYNAQGALLNSLDGYFAIQHEWAEPQADCEALNANILACAACGINVINEDADGENVHL
ncbi:MAG: hypothetical protein J6V01_06225, partial [Clostridia bacterium]|nr:hypothetical protein [Clostridia bacterium]